MVTRDSKERQVKKVQWDPQDLKDHVEKKGIQEHQELKDQKENLE